MSHHISLNAWFGSDQEQAAVKIAKVFRMGREQGEKVLRQLRDGMSWQFDQKIPDHQAGPVAAYLQSLGFHVDLKPVQKFQEEEDDFEESDAYESEYEDTVASEGPKNSKSFGFLGKGGELFVLFLTNALKTIFTLGVYHFWGKTRIRKYIWSNTTFAGDQFSYHGTGKELFVGFLKFSALMLLLIGSMTALEIYGGVEGRMTANLISIPLAVCVPALMVWAFRYRLSRTDWRGIRFSFRGEAKRAIMLYLKGGIFTLFTLGLYWPFFKMQTEKFWRENSYFGNLQGEFSGEGKEVFGKYVLAVFLGILTVGIYWIWFRAYLARYYWSKTRFGNGTFRFNATGGEWFSLYFVNLLLLAVTLGLAYPWVTVRSQKFFAEHLTLEGDLNLDMVVQEMQNSSAFGDQGADAFDIPIDIG